VRPLKELNKDTEETILKVFDEQKIKAKVQNHTLDIKLSRKDGALLVDASGDSYIATDFIVQLDKQLRESLGKAFRTSIKEL